TSPVSHVVLLLTWGWSFGKKNRIPINGINPATLILLNWRFILGFSFRFGEDARRHPASSLNEGGGQGESRLLENASRKNGIAALANYQQSAWLNCDLHYWLH